MPNFFSFTPLADALQRDLQAAQPVAADDVERVIVQALMTRPMQDFALDGVVVIEQGRAHPRIRVRIDGTAWVLDTLQAVELAGSVRRQADLRGAGLFADAFVMAARQAEARLERHHAFCAAMLQHEEG
ncbi:MAG: hypothetical protein DCF29_03765 [Alphaproteobacteria bacterium]|nr:MAG: hypothetical protein DCF29_03765 [Alphaproteobacteria bacterium]